MSVTDRYYQDAGRSGLRRYKELTRSWKHNTFGARTTTYFWTLYALTLTALFIWTGQHWRFDEGLFFGAVGAAFLLLPEATMPDYIARKQRGVWGERLTARRLKKLDKSLWCVRNDLASSSGRGNRDHVVAGPAVYLLDTKLLRDEVWVDKAGLHVRRVEDPDDNYLIPDLSERVRRQAGALERGLRHAVGFGAHVYPVVVIWGIFAAGVQWDGDVAYVDGDKLVAFLENRPADLVHEEKRRRVQGWLRELPRA